CGPDWLGQKAALSAWVRETNRRPLGARCGDDPLWIILDNQHPWKYVQKLIHLSSHSSVRKKKLTRL
ncbi:hypothetical protein, partial [Aneurinibacillus aneurinilyticus]